MDSRNPNDNRDMMSASPAGATPGRTPNGTIPPRRRRRQDADPLVRPKDRNKKPPQKPVPNALSQDAGQLAKPNGFALGRTQAMPHHPGRPPLVAQHHSTPDVKREDQPVSGFSSAPVGPILDIPLVTTKKSLLEGLRHHVARFASRKPVDPMNPEEFTRPVRLHRRDPKLPIPGKDDLAGEGGENGGLTAQEKEQQEALKEEKNREREAQLAQIAPSVSTSGQRKNNFGKKTQQVYRKEETPEQKARQMLRYEEAMPWHLEDFDNKSTWVGTYEAALSDTYVVMVHGVDGKFRMVPVEKWYKFAPKQQFKILSIDEAEKAMDKKVVQPRWFMDTQKASKAQGGKAAGGGGGGLYLGKFEAPQGKAAARSRAPKADADADDLDFEEDRFADDEENPYLEGPEEENKEIEEKVKRDQLGANVFDNNDEKEVDEEEEARKKEKELEKAFGESYRKALKKKEKNFIYESDDDENPYSEKSESDDSETERRKEEERKKEEEEKEKEKGNVSDREKAKTGKFSKNPSGSNTPSGRPSKHPHPIKKTASSNNLKRPGSPNTSDASGNESARKKQKQKHLTAAPTTLKPPSRPMSPDYAPPSSASQRPTQQTTSEQATNKRPRPEAGSGSEKSGGEMSDGKRKKQKLKLRMSASPDGTPNGSRAVSPEIKTEIKTEKSNGAGAGGLAKAANPPKAAVPDVVPPLTLNPEEVRVLIPPQGISLPDLVAHLKGRMSTNQLSEFKTLLKTVSKYDRKTRVFYPLPGSSGQ